MDGSTDAREWAMGSGVASKAPVRLADLQKAMLDATPDCIKIVAVDGNLLTMNRAGCIALGVAEDSGFGMPWLDLLPEEVRPAGREALRKAAEGQTSRFPGKSLSADGITYWDNLLTPVVDAAGRVASILCVSRDVTAKTLLERQLEEAIAREKLLSREMHHRIKNLFSLVFGLIYIAEKEASQAGTPQAGTKILGEKLAALSRASDVAFAQGGDQEGSASVQDLDAVIRSVLQPYGLQCRMAGAAVSICRDAMTTFALFLHELATNSVKYGALGSVDGQVTVQWIARETTLDLTWIEAGGPATSTPDRCGFGSEMVDRIVRSAGGTINRTWSPGGLIVDLAFPDAVCAPA